MKIVICGEYSSTCRRFRQLARNIWFADVLDLPKMSKADAEEKAAGSHEEYLSLSLADGDLDIRPRPKNGMASL